MNWSEVRAEQAGRNIELYHDIYPRTNFNDWKVTLLFYAALHLQHFRLAFLLGNTDYDAVKNTSLNSHVNLNDFITPHPKTDKNAKVLRERSHPNLDFNAIQLPIPEYYAYYDLYETSRKARYHQNMNPSLFNTGFTAAGTWVTSLIFRDSVEDFNTVLAGILSDTNLQSELNRISSQPLTPLNVP